MPRYFFHRTDGFVENDREGTELADLHAARQEALIYAGRSMSDDPDLVWDGQEFRVDVTNDTGALLLSVVVRAIEIYR